MTVRKMLNQSSIEPGKDGCYTTQQICQALFGDLRSERLRTQRQITKRYSLDNQIVEASVVNKTAPMKVLAQIADSMVHRITASSLDRHEQEDLLRDLAGENEN